MQLFANNHVFLQKNTTYRYSCLKLFSDAKSTLRTAEVQCKRESPCLHTFRLSGTVCISTQDPGRIFRDLGVLPETAICGSADKLTVSRAQARGELGVLLGQLADSQPLAKRASSKKGVSWDAHSRKWVARTGVKGSIWLGSFEKEADAIGAREEAEEAQARGELGGLLERLAEARPRAKRTRRVRVASGQSGEGQPESL